MSAAKILLLAIATACLAAANAASLNRCGTTYADAANRCATATLCPGGYDGQCPSGQHCWAAVPCSSPTTSGAVNRCGTSFTDAVARCGTLCPGGYDGQCPSGQHCYAQVSCSSSPTPTPVPSSGHNKCSSVASSRAGLVAVAKAVANGGHYISYTQGSSRWSGISGNLCYPSTPPYADCSSFQTWIYWMAFGKMPDYLNGAGWGAGYTGTMLDHGVAVSSLSAAKPGDLVFYYSPVSHVNMYIGGGQCVNYGANGPAKITTCGTPTAIRSYPAFGI